ncbi:hypothetical protein BJX63DRAFT_371865 [Aspergillus granulosus]|uniref:Uncharacterized protein n=1 Tax=Aspergillus granulosus TaxID=176169 RepID=A0ABR4H1H6_9EURO
MSQVCFWSGLARIRLGTLKPHPCIRQLRRIHVCILAKSPFPICQRSIMFALARYLLQKPTAHTDGGEVVDLWTDHPEKTGDTPCFNKMSMESFTIQDIQESQRYDLVIVITNEKPGVPFGPPGAGGVRLGGQVVRDESKAIENAVQLARTVDIPILTTGLSTDSESEALDRTSLLLPGREIEMIQREYTTMHGLQRE